MKIVFTFCTDNRFTIELEADVALPGPLPHYQAKNIHRVGNKLKVPVIPDLTLKCITREDQRVWVHSDSNMPSDLGRAIGSALEKVLPKIIMAPTAEPLEQDDAGAGQSTW